MGSVASRAEGNSEPCASFKSCLSDSLSAASLIAPSFPFPLPFPFPFLGIGPAFSFPFLFFDTGHASVGRGKRTAPLPDSVLIIGLAWSFA